MRHKIILCTTIMHEIVFVMGFTINAITEIVLKRFKVSPLKTAWMIRPQTIAHNRLKENRGRHSEREETPGKPAT